MKILVTGGAGFIGSHIAEILNRKGHKVVVYDNLSRAKILGTGEKFATYNWEYLKKNYVRDIRLIEADILDFQKLRETVKNMDVIIHTAAQTAVTTSVKDPRTDFEINTVGTFNVLEAARNAPTQPAVIFCSTNKVYGENVNSIETEEKDSRYIFKNNKNGISESLSVDFCEHTPYGCSKLSGDLYCQDYAYLYGLRVGVFRMSCIYGPRQFGVEDQGWLAWFSIATLTGIPISIYGDGKQVRDILYVSDLVRAFEAFMNDTSLRCEVFNMGGGPKNTISLIELLDFLEDLTGKRSNVTFDEWRPSDQKVYISDISKAEQRLNWRPEVNLEKGVKYLCEWAEDNKNIFM